MTPVSDQDLHTFVDGQLSVERRLEVQRWLVENPEAQQRLADYQLLNDELSHSFESVLSEAIPARLMPDNLLAQHSQSRWQKVAVVAGFTVMGSVIGWLLNDQYRLQQSLAKAPQVIDLQMDLARPALVSHQVYTPEVVHPVEVRQDQQKHLLGWLSKRMKTSIKAPDLNSIGFGLMGGRLLPGDNAPAAQLMYENSSGQRLTLYLKKNPQADQQTGFRFMKSDGVNSFYWIDGELGYALTAPLDKEQLFDAAQQVYHQLSF
ncbi:MAG: anti-sigma factor [Motiliproteus sp.]